MTTHRCDAFEGFDFGLLDDPDFREDSVREELVVPLLKALGYTASPPHRIVRGHPLQHPYVYIGTIQKPISIIPDYILHVDGEPAWILDAKGPSEAIDSGKNAEQAFSYAIHKDVRVPIYALCNGRRLTVFHVSQWPAILDIGLPEIPDNWPMVLDLLGTRAAWPGGISPGFMPDFGLTMLKAGFDTADDGTKLFHIFESVPVCTVARLEDDLYSLTGPYAQEVAPGEFSAMMLTLDFPASVYRTLLDALPPTHRDAVQTALTKQPYRIRFDEQDAPLVMVVGHLGDSVMSNPHESYCPFIAEEFSAQPQLD